MNKFTPSDKHIFTQKTLEKIDIQILYTSMTSNNKSIFVFGGDDSSYLAPSPEVWRYDISEHKWSRMRSMPHFLWGATAQRVNDEIFLMGGGRKSMYTSHNSAYSILEDKWKEKSGLPISRKGLVSCVIDDIIYIAYGYQMWGAYDVTSYCYSYNQNTDTWTKCANPPYYKSFAMSVVVDNFWYVLGGYTPNEKDGDCTSMVRYSPETDSWEYMPSMPRPRKGSVAVAIDSKIFVLCGTTNNNYPTIDYYDTIARKWTTSDIPTLQLISPGVATIDNKIYLTGGLNKNGDYNRNLYEITYDGIKE